MKKSIKRDPSMFVENFVHDEAIWYKIEDLTFLYRPQNKDLLSWDQISKKKKKKKEEEVKKCRIGSAW